jgi:hypothetical protein
VAEESESPLSSLEKRQSDRKKLIIDVSYNGGDATGIANTRDIGIGGLYMATKENLAVGTIIMMKMTLGERELPFSGVVVSTDPCQGLGVRFHNLAEENLQLLKNELGLA